MVIELSRNCRDVVDINQFELVRVLGSGGFGTCYEALHRDQRVALKKLNKTSKTKAATQSFKSETLSEIYDFHHPNIVKLLTASNEAADEKFIVMEFIEGRNLQAIIDDTDEALEFQRYVNFGIEISSALGYISHFSIAHLDLKPANVMVTTAGVCKLADFGCCQYVEKHPTTPTRSYLTGTYAYRAPELLKGRAATSKADIYSLAICLWQLWSRTNPYAGMNQHAVIFRVCANKLRPTIAAGADIDDRYKALVASCWSANIDERLSAMEVVEALQAMI